MIDLLERLARTLDRRRLLQEGEAMVVAVSGGLDSMVLLDSLQRLAKSRHWRLVVAHFNHQWRGPESLADERFVRRTAARRGLEFISKRWSREAQSAARLHGAEMAARLARHEFLARTARSKNIRTIVLAHHADDQAELFFLRLCRGAGGEGLSGMKWESPGIVPVPPGEQVRLVRPFLDFTRDDLQGYARRHRIRFREDSTNASRQPLRNRIRHELIPLLVRRFEPGLVRTVIRTMELAGTDADFARSEAERWLKRPASVRFDRLHPAVQRQCLRLQLSQLGVVPTYELVETLRQHPGRAVSLEADETLSRDDGGRVVKNVRTKAPFRLQDVQSNLDLDAGPGEWHFDGVQTAWSVRKVTKPPRPLPQAPGREYFDADRVGGKVTLRHWRKGDRFQPIGLARSVKLQDLFTNLKIPRPRRHLLVVATTREGEIWWVEQLRIGERFKLRPSTKRRLTWRWQRIDEGGIGAPPLFGR